MSTTFRRALLLWLFMFWQGGFMFYGTVVVPIGTDILGSPKAQGAVTSLVAHGLNIAGGVALFAWLWDLLQERCFYLRTRWTCWASLVLTVAALAVLHSYMDTLFDVESLTISDGRAFRQLHRWYLRISTVQWFASMALTVFTLRNWSLSDRQSS